MSARAALWLLLCALALSGCKGPAVLENSASSVTVRYDGIETTLDDATRVAARACASHGKNARLRNTAFQGLGLGERYAHFDCV